MDPESTMSRYFSVASILDICVFGPPLLCGARSGSSQTNFLAQRPTWTLCIIRPSLPRFLVLRLSSLTKPTVQFTHGNHVQLPLDSLSAF